MVNDNRLNLMNPIDMNDLAEMVGRCPQEILIHCRHLMGIFFVSHHALTGGQMTFKQIKYFQHVSNEIR